MIDFKRCLLLFFMCCMFLLSHAQDKQWIAGTWKGRGNSKKSPFIRTIVIDNVFGEKFTGTRTIEANDKNHNKIVTAISGMINKDTFYIKNGTVLSQYKRKNVQWIDCADCVPVNSITITYDSIFLISEVIGCEKACEGTFVYYKLLPDLDTATQRDLADMYGTPEQKTAFKPFQKTAPLLVSDDPDFVKPNPDSLKNVARQKQQKIQDSVTLANNLAKQRKKQLDDSLSNAAKIAKARQQQLEDSVNVAKLKRQKEIQDSINIADNLAKQRQQRISDSLDNAARFAKLRQQQIDDSVNVVKARRQKEITDSLNAVAKQKQLTTDSLNNVAKLAKIREQQIDDSLNVVKAKRQKQIQDSIDVSTAFAKKRQQQIEDSLKITARLAKQRQQQIEDSMNVAKVKRQKEIQDSIDVSTAFAKKRQQQIEDSLKVAARLAKQRQQQIEDSMNVAKVKRQKEIQDSLAVARKRQQFVDDSLKTAASLQKIREQKIQDSINIATQKRQQAMQDSLANVQKKKQQSDDSIRLAESKKQILQDTSKLTGDAKKLQDKSKALVQRDNVLLQTYHITTPDILIELFDNAQIDGDRVSVYHNNELIINNQMLTHESIIYKVHADANNRTHEFILIAENLGTIPPNTALMRITADGQVYKLSVKTDLKTNARIVFNYDGN